MTEPRALTVLTIGVLVVALPGCLDDAGPADGTSAEVAALDSEFDPNELTVGFGEAVTWTNEGQLSHTVEVRHQDGTSKVHTAEIEPGESTTYTFEQTGTFDVWCRFHGQPGEGMAMTVTVGEKGSAQG